MGKKRHGMKRHHEEQKQERQERHKEIDLLLAKQRRQKKMFLVGGGTLGGLLLLSVIIMSIYSAAQPGDFDEFAQCLTEKGAIMYGDIVNCKYTLAQKSMFGNSFDYIDYRQYYDYEGVPAISTTPTWIINGEHYPKVQSFERLSTLTGCPIYPGDTNEETTE